MHKDVDFRLAQELVEGRMHMHNTTGAESALPLLLLHRSTHFLRGAVDLRRLHRSGSLCSSVLSLPRRRTELTCICRSNAPLR